MRIITFFYCFFLVGIVAAQTPITIVESDMADEGDEFIRTNANPVIEFDAEDTGEDHTWDFSFLEPMNSDTTSWIDEEDTNPAYFFLWLYSDIAEETGADIATGTFMLEDVFNFYRKNSDRLALSGFAGSVGGVPIPVSFGEDDVVYEFPLEYNNTFSSLASFELYIPGVATWSETRDRTTTVDGWGTVITPYGEFNVLRTRSEALITDTILYDAIEIPFTYTSIEYKWLAKETGIPVLQINAQDILGSETVSQVMYRGEDVVDAISSIYNNSDISVLYPSITSGELILDISEPGNYTVEILNTCGSLQPLFFNGLVAGVNRIALPDHLSSGFYILTLKNDNGVLSTHPFIKSNTK